MAITDKDRNILRTLAGRVAGIANLPEMAVRRRRLHALNALNPEKPIVLCFPEGAWGELLPGSVCECSDPGLRGWEWDLRSRIYWWENIRDDNALEPKFNVGWRVNPGDYGVEIPYTHGGNRGSYRWDPPLKDVKADLGRIRFRSPSVDREGTMQTVALAGEIFGDLLPPRIRGSHWWTMGLTWEAIKLVGLQEFMELMVEDPGAVHALMGWLRDEHMNFISWFEREELLTPMDENDYVGSGGVGYTTELEEENPSKLANMWGFGESQETTAVSPAMFAEFILPYQLPILERFGLNCYGCCEPVHLRIDHILKVPRLRRVSVSPWADQGIMAGRLGGRIIFSRKPNPTLICAMFDEDLIRRDIKETLEAAGKNPLEIIMKDTHTVQGKPDRISRWTAIALREVDRFARR